MATELTPNLKLRVASNLDADAKFNLRKIDSLGSSGLFDSSGNLTLKSTGNIILRPGSGAGGNVSFNHQINTFSINASTININSSAAFTGGFKIPQVNLDLNLVAADISDFAAAVAATSSVSLNTAHRNDASLHFTVGSINHNVLMNVGTKTHAQIDSHIDSTSNPHNTTAAQVGAYTTAQVDALLAGTATSGHTHTSSSITDFTSAVNSNSAVAASTAHLANTNNPHATTAAQVGADTSAQVTAKVSAHSSLTTGVHGVTGTVVGTSDAQTLTNKIIDASLNTLSNIVNSNISSSAAIAGTKIVPTFGNQEISTVNGIAMISGGYKAKFKAAQSGMVGDVTWELPATDGSVNQVMVTNGAGELTWASVATSVPDEYIASWVTADGTTKTVTHSLGSKNVMVEILDNSNNFATIDGMDILRPTTNSIQLTASSAPSSTWTVLVRLISP